MKIMVISDIHLGNHKMCIDAHIKEIKKWLLTYNKELMESDLFIISGDLFDSLLTLGVVTDKIFRFFRELDVILSKNDVTLLILEGTLSHDYRQSKLLEHIFRNTNMRYYDDIVIDKVKGIDILFVPDSLPLSPDEYSEKTRKVLADKGLSEVKLSIMHGMFKHHIDLVTVPVLDQEFYSQISDLVIIGHNHRYQKWNNIYTPGSLSRDRHGEEDDKVGLLIDLETNTVKKLVNKFTRLFITVHTSDYENINSMVSTFYKYKEGTHISIKGERLSSDYKSEIRVKLPMYKLTFNPDKIENTIIDDKEIIVTNLDSDSIKKHLIDKIDNKYLEEELSRVL